MVHTNVLLLLLEFEEPKEGCNLEYNYTETQTIRKGLFIWCLVICLQCLAMILKTHKGVQYYNFLKHKNITLHNLFF